MQLPSTQPQQQGLHQHGWQADNQQGGQQQIQDTVQTVAEIHVAGLGHPGIGGTDDIDAIEMVEDLVLADPVIHQARLALTRHMRSLHVLWKEYEFGCSGCKAAKDWTA